MTKAHEEPHKKAHPDVLPHEEPAPKVHPARSAKPAAPPPDPLRDDMRAFSAALRHHMATQSADTWQVCLQSGGHLFADVAAALSKGQPKAESRSVAPSSLPDCAAALEAAAFSPTIDLGWLLQLILSILSGLLK